MSALGILLLTAGVVSLPGLVLALAAGLPAAVAVGAAAAGTYGLVAVAITVFPPLGIPWNIGSFLLLTLAGTAALLGMRWALKRWALQRWALQRRAGATPVPAPHSWGARPSVAVAIVCAVSGITGVVVVGRATSWFTAFAQGYDATFHANAIRVTADSHDVSSSVLSQVSGMGADGFFYPNGYHALSALLVQLGSSVQGTIDAQLALTPLWLAIGLAALAYSLRSRAALAALAALLSCAVMILPYDLVAWGPLLPYLTAAVLVPGVLAVVPPSLEEGRRVGWVVLGLLMAGMLALHPSVALAVGISLACLVIQRWATPGRRLLPDVGRLGGAAVLAAVVGLSQLVGAARATSQASVPVDWPADRTLGAALGELLTFNVQLDPDLYVNRPQLWLAAFLGIGLLGIARWREWWWFAAAGGIFVALFVVTAAYEGPWVNALTAYWWNDRYRFAALAAPAMIVVTAQGLVRTFDVLTSVLLRRAGDHPAWRPAAGVLGVLALIVTTNGLYAGSNERQLETVLGAGPSGGVQEAEALAFLQSVASARSTVLNDPFDGSAWMWAAYGLHPVFGQALFFPADRARIGADRLTLYDSFRDIDSDPRVREAVQHLGVEYVFLGNRMLNKYIPRAPGLTDLNGVRSVELVYSNSEASVYRVLASPSTP